ncbi:MAG: hypothetical protein FWG64_03500, partial [Firmicutes bacterium]|nr:hypothetical protein [Bacillota bacterium]
MNKFLETSAILQQMSTVLTKNQIDFTQTGIEKNLNTWDFNKNPMLYHFRNCNTWNKEHLAIVTTIESSEQTDSNNEFFKLWGILYQEHLDLRLGHVVLLSDFHVL